HPNFHKTTSAHRFQSLHSVEWRFLFASTPYRHINSYPSSYYNCCNTYYIGRYVPALDPHFRQRYLKDPDFVEVAGFVRAKAAYSNGCNENRSFYCYLNYNVILQKGCM